MPSGLVGKSRTNSALATVLDFAGAYLDNPPDFPEEIMADWRAEKIEQFGNRWPAVQEIMREFRKLGIYLADGKPGNIMFCD